MACEEDNIIIRKIVGKTLTETKAEKMIRGLKGG